MIVKHLSVQNYINVLAFSPQDHSTNIKILKKIIITDSVISRFSRSRAFRLATY